MTRKIAPGRRTPRLDLTVLAVLLPLGMSLATPAGAQSPGSGLDKCQKTVAKQGLKFVQGALKATAKCLQKVSSEIVKSGAPDPARAAPTCVKQFRKVSDSRGFGKSLEEKFSAKITPKCTGLGGEGVVGTAPGLGAENLDAFCESVGGDGAVDDLGEWLACLLASHSCEVAQLLATEYPRAAEWLGDVRGPMQALPPSPSDPTLISDAVGVLDALEAAIDPDGDDVPNIRCGPEEGVRPLLASGEMTTITSGDDGDLQLGVPLAYLDNGNGTITDVNSGLMWEKKSNDGSLHDRDNTYPWAGTCSLAGTLCQSAAECPATETCDVTDGQGGSHTIFGWVAALNAASFAGFDDWRAPNVRELQSIVDYGRSPPAIDPVFNTGCVGGCTVLTCSCTASTNHWSSTTRAGGSPTSAFRVLFSIGDVGSIGKAANLHQVRAVRGGL